MSKNKGTKRKTTKSFEDRRIMQGLAVDMLLLNNAEKEVEELRGKIIARVESDIMINFAWNILIILIATYFNWVLGAFVFLMAWTKFMIFNKGHLKYSEHLEIKELIDKYEPFLKGIPRWNMLKYRLKELYEGERR